MISSKRLTLRPLTYGQVIRYLQNNGTLESELSLNFEHRSIDDELKDAIETALLPQIELCPEVLFSTIWVVIDNAKNIMVADLCFYGEPDKNGEIEIGYGTYPDYRNQGYMSEAVGLMVKWAQKREDISSIKAKSEKQNVASARVLVVNGFNLIDQDKELYYWKISTK